MPLVHGKREFPVARDRALFRVRPKAIGLFHVEILSFESQRKGDRLAAESPCQQVGAALPKILLGIGLVALPIGGDQFVFFPFAHRVGGAEIGGITIGVCAEIGQRVGIDVLILMGDHGGAVLGDEGGLCNLHRSELV